MMLDNLREMGVWEGRTSSGRTFRLEQHSEDPLDLTVHIDGKEARPTVPFELQRDGGSRCLHTDLGVVFLPHAVHGADHRPFLDHELVEATNVDN